MSPRDRPVPYLLGDDDAEKRRQALHRRPKQQEKKVAKAIGGRRQPGSGSDPRAKGDVRRDDDGFPMLVECKRSMGKKSIRLEAAWLTKITAEAFAGNRHPALAIQFDQEIMREVARAHGRMIAEADWIAVPLSSFRGMLEALGEKDFDL